jgi:hypothetical protein
MYMSYSLRTYIRRAAGPGHTSRYRYISRQAAIKSKLFSSHRSLHLSRMARSNPACSRKQPREEGGGRGSSKKVFLMRFLPLRLFLYLVSLKSQHMQSFSPAGSPCFTWPFLSPTPLFYLLHHGSWLVVATNFSLPIMTFSCQLIGIDKLVHDVQINTRLVDQFTTVFFLHGNYRALFRLQHYQREG